jgi:hypothetical protein
VPYLVAYFGMGAIFDPIDWIDPNNPEQTMLLSLRFWHGQPWILLNVKDYLGINDISQQLIRMQCFPLAFCQLVVITSVQQTTNIITRTRQICTVMEANGAQLKYHFIHI